MHTSDQEQVFESILPGYRDMTPAIAHYWLTTWRGGEKVVKALLELFPKADLFTLFYEKEECGGYVEGHAVYTSSLDKPFLRKRYQKVFPLYPYGVRSLRTDSGHMGKQYDFIISSESGPIKGIRTHGLPHLCYVHTPMRYCWEPRTDYLRGLRWPVKQITNMLFERLRRYDETTVENVDRFVSNSENVRKRVLKHYDRETSVVYPPIEDAVFARTPQFKTGETPSYYVSFGAIAPYKRIDLLVEAFNKSGERLVVMGEGSERARLEKSAGSNITFTGFLSDEQVHSTLIKAKALLFPGEEDFGMIPLEVMALGIPVIAYAAGGALETVVENREHPEKSTGLFFETQSSTSILEAIERFETHRGSFSPEFIRNHALCFHEIEFKKRMLEQVKALLG